MSRGGNFKHQYQQSKAKGVKKKPPNQTTNKHNGHHSIMSSLFHNLKSCYVGTAASASCNDIPWTWLKKQSPNEHTDTEQQSSHGGTATLTCLSNRKSINIENKEIVMTVTGRYFKACFPVSASASTWFHLWLRTACCLAKCEKPFRWEKPLACSQMTVFGYICSRRHLLCLQFSQNTCAFDP